MKRKAFLKNLIQGRYNVAYTAEFSALTVDKAKWEIIYFLVLRNLIPHAISY